MDLEEGSIESDIRNTEISLSASPQNDHRSAPDKTPSPRSHWIDLYPIDDCTERGFDGQQTMSIPEVPPEPVSYWINLNLIGHIKGCIPEVAPEPASLFLELHHAESLTAIREAEDMERARMADPRVAFSDDPAPSLSKISTAEDDSFAVSSGPRGRDLTGHVTVTLTKGMRIPLAVGESTDTFGGIWTDHGKQKPVAIKNYRLVLTTTKDHLAAVNRRLLRESNTWLGLDHPHVLKYYGHCHGMGPTVALIYPLLYNGNILHYMLKEQCRKPVRFKFVKEIIAGLQYLHSQGVVHADLHCGNILIDDRGRAVLADFGRSKKIEPGYNTTLFCGSTRHMAPEFFPEPRPDGSEVDQDTIFGVPTDIYAFAMVCFEIMTGEIPFKNLRYDYHVISALRVLGRPEYTAEVRARIPTRLWEIMCRCWTQEPTQRPFALEVARWLADVFV